MNLPDAIREYHRMIWGCGQMCWMPAQRQKECRLLRSMSPDVVAVDELGKKEDFKAVESVVHCGCKLFATAHGNSLEDILRQPFFQKLRELEVFERYIVLGKKGHAGSIEAIYDGKGKPC